MSRGEALWTAAGVNLPEVVVRSCKKAGTAGVRVAEALERRLMLASAIVALGNQRTFSAGVASGAVVLADVNRDGKPDVIATIATNAVGVLLNDGTGQFVGHQTFADGGTPHGVEFGAQALVSADINGDGKPDLVVADYSGVVGVLMGNGDGTFGAPRTMAVGSDPDSVAAADINGDGKMDLVVANYESAGASVLLGNGDGTFIAAAAVNTGKYATSVTTADVNGDGKVDLIVGDYFGPGASVFIGDGTGAFGPRQIVNGMASRSVAVADVNRDGKPDVVLSNRKYGIEWNLGNGDGTFGFPQNAALGTGPSDVVVADVNLDGKPDVLLSNNGSVGVLPGNGDGTLAVQQTFAAAPGLSGSVAVGDVNGDGRPDVVVANQGSDAIGVMLGDVPPAVVSISRTTLGPIVGGVSNVNFTVTFNEAVSGVDAGDFAVVTSGSVAASAVVEVSGGGAVYGVTVDGVSGTGTVGLKLVDDGSIVNGAGDPLGAGAPGYGALQTYAAGGGSPESVTMADVNGDGKADALVSPSEGAVVGVVLGNGDGTFQNPRTFAVQYHPISISAVDVNGDGRLDMVVANYGEYPFGHTVSVLLGNGDGTFGAQQTYEVGLRPRFLTVADVNGDGRPDVLVTKSNGVAAGENVGVLLGNGDGTFGAMMTYGIGPFSKSIATLDANGDGRVDLVVANEGNNTVGLLLGNGDGTFKGQRTFATGPYPWSVTAGDVNGDGKADVVVADRGGRGVSVLLGNGDGTFQARQSFAVDFAPDSVVIADMNGDGRADVVVGHAVGTVGVLVGNGDGTFRPCMTFVAGVSLSCAAVSDVNRDGRPDIVGAVWGKTTISVLLADVSRGFAGQKYTIGVSSATVVGTAGNDSVTLSRDADNGDVIDWMMGTTQGQVGANDPAGLTINGGGGTDLITLNYGSGDALPGILHLNGTFSVSGFSAVRTLAGTALDVGRSTVFFLYSPGYSPVGAIRAALNAGYNGGAWNGTSSRGVITSAAAAGNANHNTGIGWADSSDGTGVNTVANSIELKYTLNGDANLNGVVDIFDLNALLPHFNGAGDWTGGDSNYNRGVDIFDLNALLPNFNTTLGSQVVAGSTVVASGGTASQSTVTAEAVNAGSLGGGGQPAGAGAPTGEGVGRKGKRNWRRWW